MSNNILVYNDQQYDLSILSKQSVGAQIDVKSIVVKSPDENNVLLVVLKDDKYEVISGSLQINQKTQQPYEIQNVKIVGKQLLKKAKLENVEERKALLKEQEERERQEREQRMFEQRHPRPQNGHFHNNQSRPYGQRSNSNDQYPNSRGPGNGHYRRSGY